MIIIIIIIVMILISILTIILVALTLRRSFGQTRWTSPECLKAYVQIPVYVKRKHSSEKEDTRDISNRKHNRSGAGS